MVKYNSSRTLKGVKCVKRLVKQYPLVQNAMGYMGYKPPACEDWIETRVIEVDSRQYGGGVCYYMQYRIPKRYKYLYTRDVRLVQEAAIHSADQMYFDCRYGSGFELRSKHFV